MANDDSALITAYNRIKMTLIPQMQGTCGVFSFHYAARLLQAMVPDKEARPIDPPKKRYGDSAGKTSIRSRAKVLLNSAQGEILTGDEMVRLVKFYSYGADQYCGPASGRAYFIKSQLTQQHPILVAYWIHNGNPIFSGNAAGAHWSVIIADEGEKYAVINPHNPENLQHFCKNILLSSNSMVDSVSYTRYWTKVTTSDPDPYKPSKMVTEITESSNPNAQYDIAMKNRKQKLENVIIAVS